MILGGGSSCQQCGCKPDQCGPCRHYESAGNFCSDALASAVATVTIDGHSATGVSGTVWSTLLSGLAVQSCLPYQNPTDAQKAAVFTFEVEPETRDCEAGGCNQCLLRVIVYLKIYPGCDYKFRVYGTYCTGACSDTGGALTFGSWAAVGSSCGGGIPSDCELDTLDWLSGFSLSGSIAFDACTCPP